MLVEKNIHTVRLEGNLGAGKTTFSKYIGELLGVKETVNSPTFVIQKSYQTTHPFFKQFIHIDLYRIENPKELEPIHFKEILATPDSLIFIEWPEKAGEYLGSNLPEIKFEHVNENTRTIETVNF